MGLLSATLLLLSFLILTKPGTSYIQASADTSGGSSGSPVILQNGCAVALVSGGFGNASTDLYLPLDLPLRVLESLRAGRKIPRGSIQSVWELQTPAECFLRGLSYEDIEKYGPDGCGLLMAKQILPGGPSHKIAEEADILYTVDGQRVASLSQYERLLDEAVGTTLQVEANRCGQIVKYEIEVQDLWSLVGDRLLEFAGSVFQDFGYHSAFSANAPIGGVLICDAAGSFKTEIDEQKLVCSMKNRPTPNLDAFMKVASEIPGQSCSNVHADPVNLFRPGKSHD